MSSHHSVYQTQPNSPAPSFAALLMSRPASPATGGSQHGGSQAGGQRTYGPGGVMLRPTFRPAVADTPTRQELVDFTTSVDRYIHGQKFILNFLNIDEVDWPVDPVLTVPAAVRSEGTIWRMAAQLGDAMTQFEKEVADAKIASARQETTTVRAQSSVPPAAQPSRNRLKTPMPSRYDGKKGDPAWTFLVACNNYRIMEPGVFQTEEMLVRWALQQTEDKAGQWAVRQMRRMDMELDDQGRPPKELRKWKNFGEFFLTQFGDPGLVEKAKQKWKAGISQGGKAVDYFEEIESLLLRLNYPRDAEMVLDQVKAGLKSHIRTQFMRKEWLTLNEMKEEVIPYDSAYWEINLSRASSEKTKTSSGSKAAPQEQSKSQTPNIKTETAKTGIKLLPQEDFEYCKKNGLCFKCKKEGLDVKGSARYHPNHSQKDKNISGKVATTSAVDSDTDVDSDSDKKSKN